MRLLANENVSQETVQALRMRGHDVVWIRTDSPGSGDQEVVHRGIAEDRIVITFDKEFGELAFRHGLFAPSGVILFRIRMSTPAYVARAVVAAIETRTDWAGYFSVVEEDRIRMRPFQQ